MSVPPTRTSHFGLVEGAMEDLLSSKAPILLDLWMQMPRIFNLFKYKHRQRPPNVAHRRHWLLYPLSSQPCITCPTPHARGSDDTCSAAVGRGHRRGGGCVHAQIPSLECVERFTSSVGEDSSDSINKSYQKSTMSIFIRPTHVSSADNQVVCRG